MNKANDLHHSIPISFPVVNYKSFILLFMAQRGQNSKKTHFNLPTPNDLTSYSTCHNIEIF